MLNRISKIIIGIREWLTGSEFIREFGKGVIYGNMVICNGGGEYIESKAL